MSSFRTMFPVLAVLAALAGCSAETGTATGPDTANAPQGQTAQADQATEGTHAGRSHGRRGGPESLLFAALHENIDLTADQRTTIEGLVSQVHQHKLARQAPSPDKTRTAALASQIRAGKIDVSAIKTTRPGFEDAMKERQAARAKALTTLHDTLTKEQRVALVDAITAKKAKWAGKRHGDHQRHAGSAGHEGMRGPFGHMLRDLNLTDEQQAQIKAKLQADRPSEADREAMKAKFKAMKTEMDAKLQTFKNDDFDANAFVTPPQGMDDKMGPGADRMAKHLSIVVSVLDQQQREALAQKIEQGPQFGKQMRNPMMRRRAQ